MRKKAELRPPEPRLSLADWGEAESVFEARRGALVPIQQPLVLISQIQRSGGTLLNSLLDGHPQLHVHPWEIQVGHPDKYHWPPIDLDAGVEAWVQILSEAWLSRIFRYGYRKDRFGGPLAEEALPLMIAPSFVDRLFRLLVADDPPTSPREVLDRYFMAFFNAWLDCQGLWDGPKKWLVGFCPRLAWGDSRGRWRSDYPDGRLVAILRDPRGWYASARSHQTRYGDLDVALDEWRTGADEIADAKREAPDQVFVLTYERLVAEPEEVLRPLAAWLEIDWAPSLLEPSFNRHPVPPNSSFEIPARGIRTESLKRWEVELDDAERARIEERELPTYHSACELADSA
jgi:hypothetical protein